MKKAFLVIVVLALASIACSFQIPGVSYDAPTSVPVVTYTPTVVAPTLVAAGPTATATPIVVVTYTPTAQGPTPVASATSTRGTAKQVEMGTWTIEYFPGATAQMRGWKFENLDPYNWDTAPNVPNPKVPGFRVKDGPNGPEVPDGLEWGKYNDQYCQQDKRCDMITGAGMYRIYTGSYSIDGVGSCEGSEKVQGCAVMIISVGENDTTFRNISADLGFTYTGQYFNGDTLPVGIHAGLSHATNRMMHLRGKNDGANCSVRTGCDTVKVTFVITSGAEVLVRGTTTVSKR